MTEIDFTDKPLPLLLRWHSAIGDELRQRGIVRSSNNPVGDFAEYLFCQAFGWELAGNSAKAADAQCTEGKLYQVKGRRITPQNSSRQLSAIRELDAGGFDFLAGVIFAADYSVLRAAIVPHATVLELATFVPRTNSSRFILRDSVWALPGVRDVTDELQAVVLYANPAHTG